MRVYADSSFLVSCYLLDSNTPPAKAFLLGYTDPLPFTTLHDLEVRNAIQLGVFRHVLTAEQAKAATAATEGDLRLQLDVKFLERIPGTGKRLHQFTAIDDYTRIRVLKVCDACTQRQAIRFVDEVLHRLPFRVLVIQTDYGAEFQSDFHWHVESRDIRHAHLKPRTPHLNGKVERSHRVDDEEFYQLLDRDGVTDDIHPFNAKLREWEDYYNYHRPHAALGGQTPYERLLARTGGTKTLPTE